MSDNRIPAILQLMDLNASGKIVVEARFLRKDENGNLIETPAEMCRRVASHVAQAEKKWGGEADEKKFTEKLTTIKPTIYNNSNNLSRARLGLPA